MRFDNWNLQMDTFPVRQYDNLTRRIEVSGDIPEGWNWVALLSIGDNLNIISLQYGEPGLYVDLTADMIPYAGKYNLQLKATQGEKARHTNIVQFTVNESMSGDVQWPDLPSAFTQAVEQAQEAANTAKEASMQYPKIIDGYWWVYDVNLGKFVNSGIYSGGSSPYIGENGNWYVGDEDTGIPATGAQGWSVSAAALDEDGALVLTIRNPADGQTQTLPPVPIDNTEALQAVAAAITAQGTAQVQRVEGTGTAAVGEVNDAKTTAIQAVGQAQGTATDAVQSAQQTAVSAVGTAETDAVQAVQTTQEAAETEISQASAQGVSAVNTSRDSAVQAVEAKGAIETAKLNAIVPAPNPEDAGKALVANEDGTGLEYGDAPGGAGIDDAVIATDSTWSSRMIVDSLAPAFEVSGPVVTCNPVAGYPLSIQAQIVPVQEGTGDPSPDNVRPISGWDNANLWVGGGNLFDIEKITNVETSGGAQIQNNHDGTIYVYAQVGDAGVIPNETLRDLIGDVPDGNYILDAQTTGTTRYIYIVKAAKIWNFGGIQTISTEILDSAFAFYASGGGTSAVISDISVYPVSGHSQGYTPYNPKSKTITIPFSQTVYGGTLDIGSGVLSVEWISHTFEEDDRAVGEWQMTDTSIATFITISGKSIQKPTTIDDIPQILCSLLRTISYRDIYNGNTSDTAISMQASKTDNQVIVRLPLSVASNGNDILNWLIDNSVEIVYRCANPFAVQLTPQEILALSGVNTIYADTGDVTVSGRADPNTVISQLAARIAALESAAVANA